MVSCGSCLAVIHPTLFAGAGRGQGGNPKGPIRRRRPKSRGPATSGLVTFLPVPESAARQSSRRKPDAAGHRSGSRTNRHDPAVLACRSTNLARFPESAANSRAGPVADGVETFVRRRSRAMGPAHCTKGAHAGGHDPRSGEAHAAKGSPRRRPASTLGRVVVRKRAKAVVAQKKTGCLAFHKIGGN